MANPFSKALGDGVEGVKNVVRGAKPTAAAGMDEAAKVARLKELLADGNASPELRAKAEQYIKNAEMMQQSQVSAQPSQPVAPQPSQPQQAFSDEGMFNAATRTQQAAVRPQLQDSMPMNLQAQQQPTQALPPMNQETQSALSPELQGDISNVYNSMAQTTQRQTTPEDKANFQARLEAEKNYEQVKQKAEVGIRQLQPLLDRAKLSGDHEAIGRIQTAIEALRTNITSASERLTSAIQDERGITKRMQGDMAARVKALDEQTAQRRNEIGLNTRAKEEVNMASARATQRPDDMYAKNYSAAYNMYTKNGLDAKTAEKRARADLEGYAKMEDHDKAAIEGVITAMDNPDEALRNRMLEVQRQRYINNAYSKGVGEEEALNKFNELYSLGWEIHNKRQPSTVEQGILKSGLQHLGGDLEKFETNKLKYTSPLAAKSQGRDVTSIYGRLDDSVKANTAKEAELLKKRAKAIDDPDYFEASGLPKPVIKRSDEPYKVLGKKEYTGEDAISKLEDLDAEGVEPFVKELTRRVALASSPDKMRNLKSELVKHVEKLDNEGHYIGERGRQLATKLAEEIDWIMVHKANNNTEPISRLEINNIAQQEAKDILSNTDTYTFMKKLPQDIKKKWQKEMGSALFNSEMYKLYSRYKDSHWSKIAGGRGEVADSINKQVAADIQKKMDHYKNEANEAVKQLTLAVKVYTKANKKVKTGDGKLKTVQSTNMNKVTELNRNYKEAQEAYFKHKGTDLENHYKRAYETATQRLEAKGIDTKEVDKILTTGLHELDNQQTLQVERFVKEFTAGLSSIRDNKHESIIRMNSNKLEGQLLANFRKSKGNPNTVPKEDVEYFTEKAAKVDEDNKNKMADLEAKLKAAMGKQVEASKADEASLKEKYKDTYEHLISLGLPEGQVVNTLRDIAKNQK